MPNEIVYIKGGSPASKTMPDTSGACSYPVFVTADELLRCGGSEAQERLIKARAEYAVEQVRSQWAGLTGSESEAA